MSRIGKEEILKACTQGIKNSYEEYLEWSSDEWLWNAPEYLLTVNIAKELWKIEKDAKFITLEDNVRATLKNADATIKGGISDQARANGRSDIVFWWGKGTPRGIIEVKNAVYSKKHIDEDLKRLYTVLENESDIEFGLTAFYVDRHLESGDAKSRVEERINENLINAIKEEAEEKGFRVKEHYQEIATTKNDKDAAFGVAIMIYK
ncbi:hypothetical protein [Nitrosophilus alvini]|uniref:hypothetical protein n=1 Tax=Nitrosophilus alvini TaxID=2714855 RepID=UPI0019098A0D|nr:hypothetical protein [Nitrosophilus alvini]